MRVLTPPPAYPWDVLLSPEHDVRPVELGRARIVHPVPAHWPPGFRERKQAIADEVARERGAARGVLLLTLAALEGGGA